MFLKKVRIVVFGHVTHLVAGPFGVQRPGQACGRRMGYKKRPSDHSKSTYCASVIAGRPHGARSANL